MTVCLCNYWIKGNNTSNYKTIMALCLFFCSSIILFIFSSLIGLVARFIFAELNQLRSKMKLQFFVLKKKLTTNSSDFV